MAIKNSWVRFFCKLNKFCVFAFVKDIESQPKLYIRGEIAPKDDGFFAMFGGESFSASDVVTFLKENKDATDIVVEISSDGGYKTEGIEIYNLLRNSGKTITTIGYKVNSIATLFMLAGNKRLVVDQCQFVIHFARIDPMSLGGDMLTAEDLQRLTDETERSDKQIVDIYCDVLGEDKRTELLAAMADERDLGSKGAIKLGFATGYYNKKKKVANAKDFSGGICINEFESQLIQNYMSDKKDKTALEQFEAKIMNAFKSLAKKIAGIKNEVTVDLSDGSQIYVVPADASKPDDLLNGTAYTVEDGVPTETLVEDGDYIDKDGSTYTIKAGVITAIAPAMDANKELTEARTKLAEAEAKLAEKDTEILALKTESTQTAQVVNQLKKDFIEFKKQVPGDKSKSDKGDEDPIVLDYSKMSTAQRMVAIVRERRAEAKK